MTAIREIRIMKRLRHPNILTLLEMAVKKPSGVFLTGFSYRYLFATARLTLVYQQARPAGSQITTW